MPLVAIGTLLVGCAAPQPRYLDRNDLTEDWRTVAEQTDYARTGRYADAVAFCRRLADFSPQARYTDFGTSPQGRALPLLILARDGAFTPEAAHRQGKVIVLLQSCIHAGECAGKDASLALARDIVVTGEYADLLAHCVVLVQPIFSTDGHERFSPYSRINQNGPAEMGWRVTARNLNLNRDYAKADALEMRYWLRFWNEWRPDVFFDNHTTNGSDHQYDLFYATSAGPLTDPGVSAWLDDELMPAVLPELKRDGHTVLLYSWPRDRRDLGQGVNAANAFGPRYSTGFGALWNRPTFLIEAHALKPYAQRVRATYNIMLRVLQYIGGDPQRLRSIIAAADERCAARGGALDGTVPLSLKRMDEFEPITYRSVELEVRDSPITAGQVIVYSDVPVDIPSRLYIGAAPDRTTVPALAYAVPPEWDNVIARLDWHGVRYERLRAPCTVGAEVTRFSDVSFPARPYEGRFAPTYTTARGVETCELPAGTVIVPTDQPAARLLAHLLEPDAPDSLVAWGLLNAIFEQKEYAETYVMEPMANEMLANDPELRAEFEQRLKDDPEFAANPRARLNFFYRRSPYWDEQKDRYPIVRIVELAAYTEVSRRLR